MSHDTVVADTAHPHSPHGHHATDDHPMDHPRLHGHRDHAGSPGHDSGGTRRPWTVLALMLAAQMMVILDVSVVNVALPSIGRALAFDNADYQWVVSAYVLLSGGLLLLGGRLADLIDRRTMFLIGLGLFTAASITSALAVSPLMLIGARAAQGAAAALLTPAALSIVTTTYTGRQRTTALAAWGTLGSMGIAAGVLVGGALTTTFGWQAVFLVNVPIGLIVALLTPHEVPRGTRDGKLRGLDLPGAATAVAGLIALVFAIESTQRNGWTALPTVGAFAAAGALLAAFAGIEARVASPLVPPATWRVRSLISASTVMAVITGAVVGAIFLSSLFLQRALGASAVVTGLEFLPLALAITAGAAVASKLLPRVGTKPLMLVGLAVVAVGAAVLATTGSDPSYVASILPGFVLLGLGTGPLFVTISVAAMSDVRHDQAGLASGVMMTGHEIGAALGVATLTAVAGDLATRTGLMEGFPRAFIAIAVAMVALAVFTALVVPKQAGNAAHGHAHGHGMH